MEWKGIKGIVLRNAPMKRYTSMRVGGPAKLLLYPVSRNDLTEMIGRVRDTGIPYRFLGNGTNIIVSDKGIGGAVIRVTKMNRLHFKKTSGGTIAVVSGGYSLKKFILECAERGLGGLEKLYWIPGTVGGAVKMNAGSFGQSVSDTLISMEVLNEKKEVTEKRADENDFGYRRSPVGRNDCVVNASFLLKDADTSELKKAMDLVYTERKKKHPMEYPSAGSIFKSVDNRSAWWFIEKAGLKGYRIGDACISNKHTNFIVNMGRARAEDIMTLIMKVKEEVFSKLGVRLEEEVELWGFNG